MVGPMKKILLSIFELPAHTYGLLYYALRALQVEARSDS